MDLDPIDAFLQQEDKRLSFQVFCQALVKLTLAQATHGFVTFEDILQILSESFPTETIPLEVTAHAALIYESSLVPVLSAKGPILRLKKEIVGSEANFLRNILNLLRERDPSSEAKQRNPIIDDFERSCSSVVAVGGNEERVNEPLLPTSQTSAPLIDANITAPKETSFRQAEPSSLTTEVVRSAELVPSAVFVPKSTTPANNASTSLLNPNAAPVNPLDMVNSLPLQANAPSVRMNAPTAPLQAQSRVAVPLPSEEVDTMPITEIERSEPIANLLAHVRKEGMDLLFPPIIHDKVLMSIFTAIKCAAPLAHRELIDMVMAVKEAAAVTQLEHLTRTKVRGVLALLKHAQLFVTHGAEGDAVRLHLSTAITSFRDLRDRHDAFLHRYMILHHLFVPMALKSEVVWQLDPETKNRRLEELKSLEFVLLDFFKTFYLGARASRGPTAPPPPPSVSLSSDYGPPAAYGSKSRYELGSAVGGEVIDDRFRYSTDASHPPVVASASYDGYSRSRPPMYPSGNLVYSSGRGGSLGRGMEAQPPVNLGGPVNRFQPPSAPLQGPGGYAQNYRNAPPPSAPISSQSFARGPRGIDNEFLAPRFSPHTHHKIVEPSSVYRGGGEAAYHQPNYPHSAPDRSFPGTGGNGGAGDYQSYSAEEAFLSGNSGEDRFAFRSSFLSQQGPAGAGGGGPPGRGLPTSEASSLLFATGGDEKKEAMASLASLSLRNDSKEGRGGGSGGGHSFDWGLSVPRGEADPSSSSWTNPSVSAWYSSSAATAAGEPLIPSSTSLGPLNQSFDSSGMRKNVDLSEDQKLQALISEEDETTPLPPSEF